MATQPNEPGNENSQGRWHRRAITLYPRFSDVPGAMATPAFEETPLDISGFRSITIEITESQDIQTWMDHGAAPQNPEEQDPHSTEPPSSENPEA